MTDDRRSGSDSVPTAASSNGAGGHAANGYAANGNVFAAIDLGTNNCRMLVARPNAGDQPRSETRSDFRVIDSFSRITRLGEGVSGSGRLSDDAMDRTIDALKCCAEKMERRRVNASRQVATEACRRAVNCSEFLDRVTRETGLSLEIISAHEEATLALKGCVALLDFNMPYALIFDIGGGSTEVLFVRIEDARNLAVQGCISLPMGVVTVAEDCGGGIIWVPLFVIRCGEESIGQIVGEEIGAGARKLINGSGCASKRGASEESANKGGGG